MRKLVVKLVKFLIKKYDIKHQEVGEVEVRVQTHYAQPVRLTIHHQLSELETMSIPPYRIRQYFDDRIEDCKRELSAKTKDLIKVEEFYEPYSGNIGFRLSLYVYDQQQ